MISRYSTATRRAFRPALTHPFGTLALVAIATFGLTSPTMRASVLWEADPTLGTNAFEGLERSPGDITVVSDPQATYGNVYRYRTWDDPTYDKERCESRGTRLSDGTNFRVALGGTYYIGWRALWNPMPTTGSWVALWQMHGYGATGEGAPLVLRCLNNDGNLYLQNNVNGTDINFWHTPLVLAQWNAFVLHVHLAIDNTGWVELWYNGQPQTFIDGTTRYYCPTWDNKTGSYNLFKWGVYRSGSLNGSGDATAYMSRGRIGTTYADVDPTGGIFSGNYKVLARHSGKAVVVQSASTSDGAAVIQYTYGGTSTNDEWQLIKLADGAYEFANRNSGKAMVVQSASTSDGAKIIQYAFGGSNTNDEWDIVDVGGGYYEIKNRMSGKALEVPGGSTSDSVQLDQRTYSGATYQQFQIVSVP
jgi:hypothetical protein